MSSWHVISYSDYLCVRLRGELGGEVIAAVLNIQSKHFTTMHEQNTQNRHGFWPYKTTAVAATMPVLMP